MAFRGFHGFRGSGVIKFQNRKIGRLRPETPKETFARFQDGFLASDDVHCISSIFIGLLSLLSCLSQAVLMNSWISPINKDSATEYIVFFFFKKYDSH